MVMFNGVGGGVRDISTQDKHTTAHVCTPFSPDNMQMLPPEGHRASVAVASRRNAFQCGRD